MKVKGVTKQGSGKIKLFIIEDFSDELKSLLRKNLRSICHGENTAKSDHKTYSYNNTVKTFLQRYSTKKPDTQKGMIGELLVHVVLTIYNRKLKTISPFLNLEESSIKKGFDIVLYEKKSKQVWIAEVKSGESRDESASIKCASLLNEAKTDLIKRLSSTKESIWLNAIHGVKVVAPVKNIKKIVLKYLEDCRSEAQDEGSTSLGRNAVLTSVLYKNLNDKITLSSIKSIHEKVEAEKKFNELIIISIQKNTFSKVEEFLKSEVVTA